LLLDQQVNALYRGFSSSASDGADQRVRVLVRMFHEFLLLGKVPTRENANV
jgi:hypothetical protein